MLATEQLKQEHRLIERMLTVIEAAAEKQKAGHDLPPEFFPRLVDFVRNFADKCHHGKEEDNLFHAMEKHGIPGQDGPIGVMLVEHDRGRAYIREVDEASGRVASGDISALKVAVKNALGYAVLLRDHIYKEDNILYNMADQVLSTAEQAELIRVFEEVEIERLGPGKHDEYIKLVEEMEKEVGIKSATATANLR
jgi:hemerythrin-like domain-containing protein